MAGTRRAWQGRRAGTRLTRIAANRGEVGRLALVSGKADSTLGLDAIGWGARQVAFVVGWSGAKRLRVNWGPPSLCPILDDGFDRGWATDDRVGGDAHVAVPGRVGPAWDSPGIGDG